MPPPRSRRQVLRQGWLVAFSFVAGCSTAGRPTENDPLSETDDCRLGPSESPGAASDSPENPREESPASPIETVTTRPERRLTLGEWYTDERIRYTVTGIELRRTVTTIDDVTYELAENKQLVVITIGLRNLDTKIRTLLADTFVCLVGPRVFHERYKIPVPGRADELDTGSLQQAFETGYPGQWTAEGLAVDPEETAETFAVFVVPGSTVERDIQIGYNPGGPDGPFPVRWIPRAC